MAAHLGGYNFKTDLFELDPLGAERTGSDGWGMEFAQWLQPQLQAQGYTVQAVNDDTCGWNMRLQEEPFKLQVNCMVMEAGTLSNAQALGIDKDDAVWSCYVHSSKPFFKSLFNKIDTEPAVQKLDTVLQSILNAEPRIQFVGEPEFDDSDSSSSSSSD